MRRMKTFKLVAGILCIVLSVLITFQSCAMGVANTLSDNGEVGGSGGFILAVMMMAGGIVMIATRSSKKRGGTIACLCLFLLAAAIGAMCAGSYSDLYIWSGLCLVLAVIQVIQLLRDRKKDKVTEQSVGE